MQTEPIEMTPAQVMQAGQGCLICDIRTDGERTYGAIPGALAMDAEALLAAQQQAGQTAAQDDAKETLRSVGARWDSLTAQERQSLVRACVEKIVLRNDKIEIFYTIDSAERSASQAG